MNHKEKNIESYNKHVKYFSEYFKKLFDLHKREEFQKFEKIIQGKEILDIGCGSGDHAIYFQEKGFNIKCIDLSNKMIELCKSKGLNASIMDIEDLNFNDETFDGIWAVTSLLHIEKTKVPKVIKKLHDILKPRGILYVCIKEGSGEELIKDKHDPTTERFFAYWEKQELLDILENHFDLIEFKQEKIGKTNFLQFFLKKNP